MAEPNLEPPDDLVLSKITDTVCDEAGSMLCAWTDMHTKRLCRINVPPYEPCMCRSVAEAVLIRLAELNRK